MGTCFSWELFAGVAVTKGGQIACLYVHTS